MHSFSRLKVNEKIFQLRLLDEVKTDSCSAKRSQTTGWWEKEPNQLILIFKKKLFRIFDDHDAETELCSPAQRMEPRGRGEAGAKTWKAWSEESEGATGNGFQQNLWKQWLAPGPWTHWLRPNYNNLNICIIWLNNHNPCQKTQLQCGFL